MHGAPRGTIDIDCIIEHTKEDFINCEQALKSIGLEARLPVRAEEVFNFRQEYIERRNMIAWGFINPMNPLECLDIIITHDLRSLRSVRYKFGLHQVSVLSIDDLIDMKKVSGRLQDLEDIKALEIIRERKKGGKDNPGAAEVSLLQLSKDEAVFDSPDDVTPIIEFLENFQKMVDPRAQHPSQLISLKVPGKICVTEGSIRIPILPVSRPTLRRNIVFRVGKILD